MPTSSSTSALLSARGGHREEERVIGRQAAPSAAVEEDRRLQRSASARSGSAASSHQTVVPAKITGRSALPAARRPARCSAGSPWAGPECGSRRRECGVIVWDDVLSTSIGHSRKTGPGRSAVASRKAIAVYSARRFVWTTVRAHLVIGRTRSRWRISCSAP